MASDRFAVTGRREQLLSRRVVLLAGPSGSGKSRVARLAGCPSLNLDDFYYDADHPDLPLLTKSDRGFEGGAPLAVQIDWDDPGSWNAAEAVAAVDQLLQSGTAEVPRYDISRSARVGSHRVDLGDATCFVAEGVFGMEMAEHCRSAGVTVERLFLDRPRILVMILRFVRDLREHRKPLPMLVRRGLALYRADAGLRRRALAADFRMVGLRQALSVISGS
ncbi:nucleoside/nucleotide kinase family protein [Microlunatus soli]|uniref:Uridine kinase n=1 Tax=Microlunatus soli TaxID=630515 RepID=A0A1H1X5I1_9ACTN|nr:uridine kinase [Microlunatus soli]SDT03829.1 uridine kinase [Microlunatus soli]